MSGQPPIRPEQGSYGQFQVATSQPKTLCSRSKDILAKLRESIPQNETQWQQARDLHGYSTAGNVLQKTRDILENRITKQDLRNFLTIASCCVDWHLGRKQEAYQKFKMQISAATELTIQKYMSSLRAMVQAMEPVYLRGPRHRVFEGTLLYCTYRITCPGSVLLLRRSTYWAVVSYALYQRDRSVRFLFPGF